jgi:hypothetical protein
MGTMPPLFVPMDEVVKPLVQESGRLASRPCTGIHLADGNARTAVRGRARLKGWYVDVL